MTKGEDQIYEVTIKIYIKMQRTTKKIWKRDNQN